MDVPAGWYPDPVDSGLLRYWMGTTWSQSTQPVPPPTAFLPPVGPPVMTAVMAPVLAPAASLVLGPSVPSNLTSQRTGDVFLPARVIEQGGMPCVCVKHGRTAVQMPTAKVYSRTPIWVFPVIVLSLLIGALVAAAVRVTVAGMWPVCDECVATRKRRRNAMWGCIIAIPVLLVLGGWLKVGLVGLIPLLLAPLAALVFGGLSSWTAFTNGSVDRQTHVVRIRRPTMGFVGALPSNTARY